METIKIPVPYKGIKYEIRINHILKPVVGYHVCIYRNGKERLAVKGTLGTIEDAKREGSKMIVQDYNLSSSADASSKANLATANDSSPYANGTIKLTWVDKNDNKILYSKMFNDVEEALKNTYEKKNWLIFKLRHSSNDGYDWELLPYGRSKSYKRSIYFSDKPLLKLFIFGLAATGAYFIGKAIYDNLKEGGDVNSFGSNLPNNNLQPSIPITASIPKP